MMTQPPIPAPDLNAAEATQRLSCLTIPTTAAPSGQRTLQPVAFPDRSPATKPQPTPHLPPEVSGMISKFTKDLWEAAQGCGISRISVHVGPHGGTYDVQFEVWPPPWKQR